AGAAVAFGSAQSTAVTVGSSTQVNAMSPPGSAGTVAITVTNPDAQSASLPSAFTYSSGPSLTSISPNTGPVTGGTTVTILGSGFQSGARVTFGGIAAASVTLVSSTQVQAVSPVSPAGTVTIAVTNPDSQSGTLDSSFTYYHTVGLSWTGSSSPAYGYNIYRSSTSGGPYTRLNSNLLSGTSFSDNNVQAGQTYFYVTTAVNNSNMESSYSNQAQAVIPSP
ncbi:MAG TPA: IPT/TIG domain-containing protein, partial [Terriglobia bacterium]|nr:IPT/TIG domain-containing protein [Terriglobia bacterium]